MQVSTETIVETAARIAFQLYREVLRGLTPVEDAEEEFRQRLQGALDSLESTSANEE